jgi:ABC-type multidrug transport system fused ATPase/permease subunit
MLNEATSALDTESEYLIKEALQELLTPPRDILETE